MKRFFLCFIIFSIIILPGCKQRNYDFERKDAILMAVSLLKVIQAEDYAKMRLYYSDDFFSKITEVQWIGQLKQIREKLGNIESNELSETEITNENNNLSVTLTYKVKRKIHNTEERFVVFCSNNSTKITAHNIKI